MKIYRSLDEVPAGFGPSALTIGNFDGVHHGHRLLLRRLVSLAAEQGWKPSVLTFHPHPTCVVAPHRTPPLMSTPDQRAGWIAAEGIEQLLILPFTVDVAHLTPGEFARGLLVERLKARAVLIGDNFRFGHGQAGDVRVLSGLGHALGFETVVVPAVRLRGRMVSSSAIRGLIGNGLVHIAARLLERPYSLEGEVVGGRGVGSKQTVPTLNLATRAEVIPARGVYVTRTSDLSDGRTWDSITNIGYRPTFGESDALSIETFLLSPLSDDAPAWMRVEFLWRVRDERRFDSPESLKAQIIKDVGAARRYFRRSRLWIREAPCHSC
jgi:riboflavin kinase / FMN adenylyltransferase